MILMIAREARQIILKGRVDLPMRRKRRPDKLLSATPGAECLALVIYAPRIFVYKL